MLQRPFDKRDPTEWGGGCRIKVCFYWGREDPPSFYRNTHAYLFLYDENGDVRSAGQDMIQAIERCSLVEKLSCKEGYQKIETPDSNSWHYVAHRVQRNIIIPITKKEHDRTVKIVERDKSDKHRVAHLTMGNCVSWTMRVLNESIGLEVDASFHILHVFLRENIRIKWLNRLILKCYNFQKKSSKKAKFFLLFFPPYYLIMIGVGIIIRIAALNKNYRERKIRLRDVLLHPNKVIVHHPVKLFEELSKMADENGCIKREKKDL